MSTTEMLWTSQEAEAVTGGKSAANWCAAGVSINIDDLKPGDLYIATKEDDLDEVFARGAAAAVVSGHSSSVAEGALLKVGDVFEALQNLAGAARYRTHATIISVQDKTARPVIRDLLAERGQTYEGGRHLSLGLANLPEDVEFGLFGFSPLVRPDIAVITNAAGRRLEALFEMMPVSGTVIVNADDEEFLSVVARAKAAGVQNILTYGRSAVADASLCSHIQAENGTRLSLKILDENYEFFVADVSEINTIFLAALLILKLNGKALPVSLQLLADTFESSEKQNNSITLMDPVLNDKGNYGPQAVFKITNMVDFGYGRQTVILDNLTDKTNGVLSLPKKDLAIPRSFASFNLVYTSKKFEPVYNAYKTLKERYRHGKIETVAPEVLSPGDFLVFKQFWNSSKASVSDILRLVPDKPKSKTRYAV